MDYKLIKHRGISDKSIHENTYLAIKNALVSSRYVGIEFDIRTTLDKEFIVFHNAIFNNKLVKNTLYKDMPRYVSKLEDILKIKSNKIFLIEIKDIENNYSKLIKILNKYRNKNIYVMSFSNKAIKKMDIIDRNYKIGVLNYILNTDNFLNKLDFICILNNLLNTLLIKKLSGLEIFSYGIIINNYKYKNIFYITND